jgi:Transposase DDE domain
MPSDVRHSRADLRSTLEVDRLTAIRAPLTIRRYSTSACKTCVLKAQCTTGPERRISRWEHEAVLEKVQDRLDHNPNAMGVRRQTAEHPFGTIKCWMGATHFLTKRLPKLNVLAYNLKRVLAILGVSELLEAMLA